MSKIERSKADKAQRRQDTKKFIEGFFDTGWIWICLAVVGAGAVIVGALFDRQYDGQAYEITPSFIVAEYEADDISSEYKYSERPVIATGRVETVENAEVFGVGTRLKIVIRDEESDNDAHRIECYFKAPLEEVPEAQELETGQSVAIEGTFLGISFLPMMGNCSIVGE